MLYYIFSLKCNTTVPDNHERSEIRFKWSDAKRERFRSGVISCLHRFYNIVEGIDCSDRSSVNKNVNDFSDTMRSVADPLFSKCHRIHKTHYFVDQSCFKKRSV